MHKRENRFLDFLLSNTVTIIFTLFVVIGFIVSKDLPLNFFLNELSDRIFRNLFLVLSLIIPVVAGLGLNFGIVIGAMSGQIAIIIVRYFGVGGFGGLMLCFAISLPISILVGYFTGKLYNKTRGREMIASLIVGNFANGIYQFLLLFVIGYIIKVPATHPLIKPDGVGIRVSVDLLSLEKGGLKYSLDYAMDGLGKIFPFLGDPFRVRFIVAVMIASGIASLVLIVKLIRSRGKTIESAPLNTRSTIINASICGLLFLAALYAVVTKSSLMMVKAIPLGTAVAILLLCLFTWGIMRTKLGQDFRAVGQSQTISDVAGIDVDRTRIIATILSTILASWGMIIYLQNMGTLTTYSAHTQVGMFSVAALLVGGASTSRATIKHALVGTILFNAMFIISPEIGKAVFSQAILGEYFRTFMVHGVIGLSLGLYVWRSLKATEIRLDD